ncbi:FAD-dependent oxidoreductase [Myxococcota bacterium]|nr:FAD-dependent oxidoreductase [Myxococcota bacterium]
MNVIVIGAGLAGLAAAERLKSSGHDVCLLERSGRVGGQIGVDVRDSFRLPRTLESLHAGDRNMIDWIRSSGLAGEMLPLRPLQIAQIFKGESTPIDSQSMGGVATLPGVRFRDAARLLRWPRLMARYAPLLDPAAPEQAASLDYRSVADFARLYFGSSLYERWVEPEVRDVFGSEGSELSRVAALLIWQARDTGQSESVVHGIPRAPLALLAERVAEGIEIRFGLQAIRIEEATGGGYRVICQASTGGQGELEADAVVMTTDASEAHRLVSEWATPAERDFFSALRSESELTLSLALSEPPSGLPQRIRFPQAEGTPFDCMLVEPGGAGARAPQGKGLAVIRATERFTRSHAAATDDVVIKGLTSGLERVMPSAAAGIEHVVLHRRDRARARFDVGAYRALAQFRRVQEDRRSAGRRLYFAGDYLIGPGPESSASSGLRAAAELVADAQSS